MHDIKSLKGRIAALKNQEKEQEKQNKLEEKNLISTERRVLEKQLNEELEQQGNYLGSEQKLAEDSARKLAGDSAPKLAEDSAPKLALKILPKNLPRRLFESDPKILNQNLRGQRRRKFCIAPPFKP